MVRLLKNTLAVIVVALLVWYISRHWDELEKLLKLSVGELTIMYVICFLGTLNSAYVIQHLLKVLKVKTSFWDMVLLQNTTYLLNYVPMKFGTLFRANYLKRHYGLIYAHFGVFFVYVALLMTIVASAVGLAVLLSVYGINGRAATALAIVFSAMLACCVILVFVPLPIPPGSGKLSTSLRNFLQGRKQVVRSKHALLVCTVLLAVNFIFSSVRLGIIYNSMDQDVHPAGYLLLGALGLATMFVSVTPGSVGVRELVLGFSATALGIPLEVGVLAAMIDRAVVLLWCFVIGGACTAWLWFKSPADFKEARRKEPKQQFG